MFMLGGVSEKSGEQAKLSMLDKQLGNYEDISVHRRGAHRCVCRASNWV